jgi:hypothetical protein
MLPDTTKFVPHASRQEQFVPREYAAGRETFIPSKQPDFLTAQRGERLDASVPSYGGHQNLGGD